MTSKPIYLSFYFCSDPSHDQIFGYVDQFINLNDILYPKDLSKRANGKARVLPENTAPFRPSDLISSCHKNESIYSVSMLHIYSRTFCDIIFFFAGIKTEKLL